MAMYRHTYQSVPESEEQMMDNLQSILAQHKIEDSLAGAIMLTVSEAFVNAFVHGNKRELNKTIQVEIEITPLTVKASVIDQGERHIDLSGDRPVPDPFSENGRGIAIMRHYATSLIFSGSKSGGLKVSIQFDRKKYYESKILK